MFLSQKYSKCQFSLDNLQLYQNLISHFFAHPVMFMLQHTHNNKYNLHRLVELTTIHVNNVKIYPLYEFLLAQLLPLIFILILSLVTVSNIECILMQYMIFPPSLCCLTYDTLYFVLSFNFYGQTFMFCLVKLVNN